MHEFFLLFIISSLIFFWLILLSILFVKQNKHYQALIGTNKGQDIETILTGILRHQKRLTQENVELKHVFQDLEKNVSTHIQKVGFVRFNPFEDTGGDQSFALALLDTHKNGMVFTFLHSRDTTRVYAKRVIRSKSDSFPLSKEEEYVIASVS